MHAIPHNYYVFVGHYPMNKKNIKDFLILFGVIILAAIAARVLAGGETLTDYAHKTGQDINAQTSSGKELSVEEAEDADAGSSESSEDDSAKESSVVASTISSSGSSGSSDVLSTASSDISADAASDITDIAVSEKSDADVATTSGISPDRVTYMEGFYYEPISDEVFHRISGISYPVECKVALDELRYVGVLYIDFDGQEQVGELICNARIAQDLVEVFYGLYSSDYQIESIKLVDEFNGDDTASMLANNTSCFNYRFVEGTTRLSNHAYGLAIDLNPFYNPYITYNKDMTVHISPAESEPYADRSKDFPYKIDENDLAYKLFKEHGFK